VHETRPSPDTPCHFPPKPTLHHPFSSPIPPPSSLLGNILIPLTVHLMTGTMSGRVFWSLVLASSIGRLVFAGGVVWAVNLWREEIAKGR
jgi:hypothetical protein